MIFLRIYTLTALSLLAACNSSEHKQAKEVVIEAVDATLPAKVETKHERIPDSAFVVMNEYTTGFDHFGKEAHHAYTDLPDTVLANRRLLKETMEAFGFSSITSEWWHYNFKSAKKYALSDFMVDCDRDFRIPQIRTD